MPRGRIFSFALPYFEAICNPSRPFFRLPYPRQGAGRVDAGISRGPSTTAERIPRPYARAEENARALHGLFGRTFLAEKAEYTLPGKGRIYLALHALRTDAGRLFRGKQKDMG